MFIKWYKAATIFHEKSILILKKKLQNKILNSNKLAQAFISECYQHFCCCWWFWCLNILWNCRKQWHTSQIKSIRFNYFEQLKHFGHVPFGHIQNSIGWLIWDLCWLLLFCPCDANSFSFLLNQWIFSNNQNVSISK